jgi:hypothetical protein
MEIKNTKVYGLEEAIIASHYPMSIDESLDYGSVKESDLKRAKKLGSAPARSGHDTFLKGILVSTDIIAPQYFWQQFQRYHFWDFVSSQSKMHSITQISLEERCNKYVDQRVIRILKQYIEDYKQGPTQEGFQKVLSNVPMGLELTARITTNYLQLKTIYSQRKTHRLEEWHFFCKWCENLPNFIELTQKEQKEEQQGNESAHRDLDNS